MNILIGFAGLSGAMAVAAGAFGSHGATGKAAEWLHLGGTYQLIHAVAAIAAMAMLREAGRPVALLFLIGALVFSGSLYLMALGAPRWLGATAPIGGTAMILGWLWLAWAGVRAAN